MTHIEERYSLLLKPWGNVADKINSDELILEEAFQEVKKFFGILDHTLPSSVLELMLSLLEHNNIIFYRQAAYSDYQIISEFIFKNFERLKMTQFQRHRFFSIAVYSDYYMQNIELSNWFEEKLVESFNYFKEHPKDNYNLLSAIHLSQYYLFVGKLDLNTLYLEKAHNLVETCNNNYKLFFFYHYAWSSYEKGDYIDAINRVNRGINFLKKQDTAIALHFFNIKASILYKLTDYSESLRLAEVVYKKSIVLFNKRNQDVVAESLLTIAKNFIMLQKYTEGLNKAKESISLLEDLFGGSAIDPSQAVAFSVCADAYMGLNQNSDGKLYYNQALNIYKKLYGDKISYMPEVKSLESKLKVRI